MLLNLESSKNSNLDSSQQHGKKALPQKSSIKQRTMVLTFKVAGQLAVLGLEREELRRPAVVVLDDEAGAGRHQHVADAAPLRQGRFVEGRLAAGWGKI